MTRDVGGIWVSSTLFIYASGRRWLLVVVVVRRCAVTVLASTTISSTVVLYTLQYNTERLPAIHQVTLSLRQGLGGNTFFATFLSSIFGCFFFLKNNSWLLFIYASGRWWLLVVVCRCAVTVLASTISSTVVYTLQYNTERLPAIH